MSPWSQVPTVPSPTLASISQRVRIWDFRQGNRLIKSVAKSTRNIQDCPARACRIRLAAGMDQYPRQYLYLRAMRAKLFIDGNFASDIDLDKIADEACFSKFHFI